MGSNMEKVFIKMKKDFIGKGDGKMGRELNGWKMIEVISLILYYVNFLII